MVPTGKTAANCQHLSFLGYFSVSNSISRLLHIKFVYALAVADAKAITIRKEAATEAFCSGACLKTQPLTDDFVCNYLKIKYINSILKCIDSWTDVLNQLLKSQESDFADKREYLRFESMYYFQWIGYVKVVGRNCSFRINLLSKRS